MSILIIIQFGCGRNEQVIEKNKLNDTLVIDSLYQESNISIETIVAVMVKDLYVNYYSIQDSANIHLANDDSLQSTLVKKHINIYKNLSPCERLYYTECFFKNYYLNDESVVNNYSEIPSKLVGDLAKLTGYEGQGEWLLNGLFYLYERDKKVPEDLKKWKELLQCE